MSKVFTYDLKATNGVDFDSSAVETLAFDRERDVVFVEFTSGGSYTYEGVAESTYAMWVDADSQGKFYYQFISGTYDRAEDVSGLTKRAVQAPADTSEPDLKPDVKWATVPQAVQATQSVNPGRFSVKYTVEHDGTVGGPFEPEFHAVDEADALRQLNSGLSQLETLLGWTDLTVKIASVTRYFD